MYVYSGTLVGVCFLSAVATVGLVIIHRKRKTTISINMEDYLSDFDYDYDDYGDPYDDYYTENDDSDRYDYDDDDEDYEEASEEDNPSSDDENVDDIDEANSIEIIEKSKDCLPNDSVAIITDAIKDHKITSLNLKNRGIRNKGAKLIGKILKYTRINRLELGENDIGTGGAKAIASALKDTRITHLDFGETRIDNRGVKFIADELKNTRLTSLVLGRKKIGNDGAEAIANVLKESQIISMDLKGYSITETAQLSLLMAMADTQIIEMKLETYGAISTFIAKTCKDNLARMNEIYEEFQRFVSMTNDCFEFVIDDEDTKPSQYIDFAKKIVLKRQSYIDYFVSDSNKTFTRDQIEDFIENIEKRLTEFFSNLAYTCIEHTKLLLLCEREGLSMVVEGLLDHRPNYVVFEDILHPAVCILMNKYGKPWRFENMKPTTDELLKIWNNFDLDDLLMEDQLTDCNCHDFTRKAFVKLLSKNQ